MARRNNDPGFGMVIVAAVALAVGFAGFLFWRSQQKNDQAASTAEPRALGGRLCCD